MARVTGPELHEAIGAAKGVAPATADDTGGSWPDSQASHQRQWPRCFGRALTRVDVWILVATVAGVVIAYLTLVKPR